MVTVGVVIPIYRCAPYVASCLESVLAQTYSVSQIVLVDDCGGDESMSIAEEVLTSRGHDYIAIRQPHNGGLGRARNTGLEAITTDAVWFLDSDDTAEPTFVESLVTALTTHDAQIAVCRTQRVDEAGTVLQIDEQPPRTPVLSGEDYAREVLCGRAKAYACTKLFRREVLGSRPWAEDQAYEDFATTIRLSLSSRRVATLTDPLYRYLYRQGSLSTALTPATLDLFLVESDVRELIYTGPDASEWKTDFVGFRYREVLTSVAHVAMRADHQTRGRPPHYAEALTRVQHGITWRDLPTLIRGRYFRESIFAVLVAYTPGLYSMVLRRR